MFLEKSNVKSIFFCKGEEEEEEYRHWNATLVRKVMIMKINDFFIPTYKAPPTPGVLTIIICNVIIFY